jgi:hypothetical protein
MADALNSGICHAHKLVDNNVDKEVSICIKCSEYESQLKEAFDELSSLKLVNKLLQKEVLAYTTHKSTWQFDRVHSGRIGDPMEHNGLTSVTNKTRTRIKNSSMKFHHTIQTTNRYTPLNDKCREDEKETRGTEKTRSFS